MSGDPRKEDELISRMVSELPEKKEAIMSYAKRMEEIGLKKGLEAGLHTGLEMGLEKGLEKGRFEGRYEVAKALAEEGVDLSFISRTTGLSMDELKTLSGAP
jgi:recombination-promoting nuclease RpnB